MNALNVYLRASAYRRGAYWCHLTAEGAVEREPPDWCLQFLRHIDPRSPGVLVGRKSGTHVVLAVGFPTVQKYAGSPRPRFSLAVCVEGSASLVSAVTREALRALEQLPGSSESGVTNKILAIGQWVSDGASVDEFAIDAPRALEVVKALEPARDDGEVRPGALLAGSRVHPNTPGQRRELMAHLGSFFAGDGEPVSSEPELRVVVAEGVEPTRLPLAPGAWVLTGTASGAQTPGERPPVHAQPPLDARVRLPEEAPPPSTTQRRASSMRDRLRTALGGWMERTAVRLLKR